MATTLSVAVEHENQDAKEIALTLAKGSLNKDKMFRLWAVSHGGVYVPVTERTPPNPALSHIPNRDLFLKDMNLTLMNAAYMLRQMMNEYEGLYGLKGHITSLKPLNPDSRPDSWERKILEGYEKGDAVTEVSEFLEQEGKPYLRIMEPLVTKELCLKCHGIQGYKTGDARGGVSVRLPMQELHKQRDAMIAKYIGIYLLAWLAGMGFIGYFYKRNRDALLKQETLYRELSHNEEHLRTIIDTDDNIIVTTFGQKIDTGNRAMLEFTGFENLEAFHDSYACLCDLFEKREGYLQPKMNGLNWVEYIVAHPEKTHKAIMRKDKQEHTFIIHAKKLLYDTQERYVAVLNDVTELLRSQVNLAKAQQIAHIGHWEFFLKSGAFTWSDELYRIFGLKPQEFESTYEIFIGTIHPEDRKMVEDAFLASIEKMTPYNIVHRIVRRDNSEIRIIEEHCEHYRDEEGNIIYSLGTVQDITEHEMLERKLHEKEEVMIAQSRHAAMGEMISMIAHQWRQPITTIAMGTNNIIADIELEETDQEVLKNTAVKIMDQTQQLSKTIDDFINFFRPDKERERVLVNDIVEENFAVIGKSLENNNITVEKDYRSHTPVEIYSRELLQVLINIIKNAKEALIDGKVAYPKITVETFEDDENIMITVCNNGKGIDETIINRIFEPYFTTKDEKIGTGLGLYISKTIVEKHLCGQIHAYNPDNGGVCFSISLPKTGSDDA